MLKALLALGMKLLAALGSEILINWAFWKIAQVVVDSTETPHDNEFLEKLREVYESDRESTK